MVGIGYFGAHHLELVLEGAASLRHFIGLAVVLIAIGFLTWRHLHKPSAGTSEP